ncbi:group II intron maturase-specific domain-containing protein, partial [Pseudoalteromonas sp. S3431]|uniref:group II intron maturase-specific domain-containing protein n=1 Tax=Pseudoalteromonas sp. S3431 TaxID=579537 RepID=UPI002FBE9ED0
MHAFIYCNIPLKKFKANVRELTNRNWGISMTLQIHKLTQYLRGWGHYGNPPEK